MEGSDMINVSQNIIKSINDSYQYQCDWLTDSIVQYICQELKISSLEDFTQDKFEQAFDVTTLTEIVREFEHEWLEDKAQKWGE